MHRSPEPTEDQLSPDYQPRVTYPGTGHGRQPMYRPHTYLGAAGHWIHLTGVALPLVIPEIIKDPDARWRALLAEQLSARISG